MIRLLEAEPVGERAGDQRKGIRNEQKQALDDPQLIARIPRCVR